MSNEDLKKVVLIDDDEEFLDLFKSRLLRWNVDFTVVTNVTVGDITMDKVNSFLTELKEIISMNREECAAIFLDLGLNTIDKEAYAVGFKVGKELRKEFYDIPILILTQYGRKEILAKGYFYDFDAYLEKSLFSRMTSEEFHGNLYQALEKRRAMVENLPNYYVNHVKRNKQTSRVTIFQAFDTPFVSQGGNLEKTLDSAISWEQYFASLSRVTVIMFADLVGSTEIKESSGIFEGLRVTRFHNQVITGIVKDTEGTVVKYVGDCVMARYDYESEKDVDCRSINAAIEIQEAFSEYNKKTHQAKPIETTIGISSGKAADFYGNDPQGSCVDLAARLQARAKSNQILVTEDLLDLVGVAEISSRIGKAKSFEPKDYKLGPVKLKLKGFREPTEVYEINWNDDSKGINNE